MTEQPKIDLSAFSDEIKKISDLLTETVDKLETVRDEVLESIEDQTKDLSEILSRIEAYQKNVLEPNQQTIYKEIRKVTEE